ncbi:MAG TPA: S8 family serine peptidase [Gemmataceae bacterium]|nr:S8 family serine peptidase [Gemmataceae bacterium]
MSSLRTAVRWVCLRACFVAIAGPALLGLSDRAPQQGHAAAPAPAVAVAKGAVDSPAPGPRDHAVARLGVDSWHQAGIRGRGVKVAILDSGFHDYRTFLGNALPANVAVKSFRRDGNLEARDSQHGILCADVIHTIAPDAQLLFANWEPDRPESFLKAAQWAKEQGAKVISCSIIMPSWSDGEGGGDVHAALAKIVGGDMLFCASAGNLAQRHWSGAVNPDADGFHQWTPDCKDNAVIPWGDERVSVELYGPSCRDLELQVLDSATGTVLGRCRAGLENSQCGCCNAVVRFQPRAGQQYVARVRRPNAETSDKSAAFHIVVLGGGLQETTAAGSIPFPGDGKAVHAIGAVDSGDQRLSYSSCGSNSALPKPDFVAAIPFPSAWREKPFAGTSAAAPQAAALAALVWALHPAWTAAQISQYLAGQARDLGPIGHDCETGHGLLHLPAIETPFQNIKR